MEEIVSVVGVPEPHDVNASAASTINKNVIFFIWINIQTIFAFTNLLMRKLFYFIAFYKSVLVRT